MYGLILLVTKMQKIFVSDSEEQTAEIARKFAQMTQKGDVFALYGTLGMGKSVFARAFIQILTKAEEVPSPTFTLVQSYEAPAFEIYHFDLYRLKSEDEVFELGFEEAIYDGVCLIEWPERAGSWLPRDVFKITFESYENSRQIKVEVDSKEKEERIREF